MADRRYTPGHSVARLGVFLLPILPICFTHGWASRHGYTLGWWEVATVWFSALLVHFGLIAGHEASHYYVARAVGIQVIEITVGHWRKLWSRQFGQLRITLRAIPDSGYVLTLPSPEWGSRWRRLGFLSAGITFDLAAAVAAGVTLWTLPPEFSDFGEYLRPFLLWSVVVFGTAHVVLNLWPRQGEAGGASVPTDGRQIADTLNRKTPDITEALEQGRSFNAALVQKDYPRAIAILETVRTDRPRDVAVASSLANLLAHTGEHDRAIGLLRDLLDTPGLSAPEKAQVLDSLACIPLYHGLTARLGEAEAWVRTAITYSPNAITLQGTLGAVLLELNRCDEAKPILERVLARSEDSTDLAISRACLAKIACKQGNIAAARTLLLAATEHSPRPELVERIARELHADCGEP